jgi:hypothetical protein
MQVLDKIVYVYLVNTLLQQHKALRQVASILKISNLKSHCVILTTNQERSILGSRASHPPFHHKETFVQQYQWMLWRQAPALKVTISGRTPFFNVNSLTPNKPEIVYRHSDFAAGFLSSLTSDSISYQRLKNWSCHPWTDHSEKSPPNRGQVQLL